MPVQKLFLGTSKAKKVYLGTSKVKYIYIDNRLVFADPQVVTINKGTGVASVKYSVTEKDGSTFSGTITGSAASVPVGYGAKITFTPTASTGYSLNSYTSSATITADASYSFSATVKSYTTTINIMYSSTEWGNTQGSKIGTFQYSTNNSTWTTSSDASITANYGSKIYIRSISPAPGFALSSVTYNGTSQTGSSGTYTITVGAGNYAINVNMISTTSTSSVSFAYASTVNTNSLSRSAWTVTAKVDILVAACSQGATIGTIPAQYRPASAQTVSVTWTKTHNASTGVEIGNTATTATITINTNGTIVSSVASNGKTTTTVGGGKWSSGTSLTTTTYMAFNLSWSVK